MLDGNGTTMLERELSGPSSMLTLSNDGGLLCFCGIQEGARSKSLLVYSLVDHPALQLTVPFEVKSIEALEATKEGLTVTADGFQYRFELSGAKQLLKRMDAPEPSKL